jgi:DnaJ-class molecular chaperone
MTCKLCRGSGNLVHFEEGRPIYWTCPCCGGSGVSVQHGPAMIGPGTRRSRRGYQEQ